MQNCPILLCLLYYLVYYIILYVTGIELCLNGAKKYTATQIMNAFLYKNLRLAWRLLVAVHATYISLIFLLSLLSGREREYQKVMNCCHTNSLSGANIQVYKISEVQRYLIVLQNCCYSYILFCAL